jgi:hypothetical protein
MVTLASMLLSSLKKERGIDYRRRLHHGIKGSGHY